MKLLAQSHTGRKSSFVTICVFQEADTEMELRAHGVDFGKMPVKEKKRRKQSWTGKAFGP